MKKRNLASKIMTTGLAAALALSMSAPVFAATQVDGVNAVSNDASATIGKTLQMATQGVDNPGFTFTFNFKPVLANQTETTTTGSGGQSITTKTWDYGITKTGSTKGDQTVSPSGTPSSGLVTGKTSAVFAATEFTEAGVYGYIVEENSTAKVGNNNWTNNDTHVLTMDTTKYLVRIKVVNGDNGRTIEGISAQPITSYETNSDGQVTSVTIPANSAKIDGSTEEGGTSGSIPFTNRYTEYANDDGTGSNPENNGLVISKKVSGQGSNANDTFTFKITFTKDTYNVSGTIGGTTTDLTTTKTTAGKDLYTAQTCAENQKVTAESLTYGDDYYFQLTGSGSDQIAFKVPAGTSYTVEEVDNGEYTSIATKTVTDGGTASDGTSASITSYVGDGTNTVEYTNTKTANPLTGIVNNYGGLIAVVAIAAGGMVVLTLRRRREDV